MGTTAKSKAFREYVAMIRKIGMGFHPDTPKGDYSPPLPKDIRDEYDRVLENAWRHFDPYAVAVRILMPREMKKRTGWDQRRRNPAYSPKTGQKCSCRPGVWRDNCPNCEGTGRSIDFRAIERARMERQGRVPAGMCDWPIYPRTCSLKKGHGGACVPYKARSNPRRFYKTDKRGVEYVGRHYRGALPRGWATCGHCGRSWNDEKSTSVTPTPSARCPFEYEHVYRSRRSNPSLDDIPDSFPDWVQVPSGWTRRVGDYMGWAGKAFSRPGYKGGPYVWSVWHSPAGGKNTVIASGDARDLQHAKDWADNSIGRHATTKKNPSHADCPGGHSHYQGKCFTDWNWGTGANSNEARKVFPKFGFYAIVKPGSAGYWSWHVHSQTGPAWPALKVGSAASSSAAKAAVTKYMETVGRSRRSNPGLGMPGMPHTWVTANGVHVSAGDTVEYWSKEGLAYDAKPERRRAPVLNMLVFDDHVQVKRGPFGNTVDDSNFIRVVRKAARRNPILTVLSNPGRSRRSRFRSRRTATALCAPCCRQATSGGHEPLGPGLRAARRHERCGAWDCVKRAHPERSRRAR